jgi:hypothetical protein
MWGSLAGIVTSLPGICVDTLYIYKRLALTKPPCRTLLDACMQPRYPIRWSGGGSGQAYALAVLSAWIWSRPSELAEPSAEDDPLLPFHYTLLPFAAWELTGMMFLNPFVLGLGTISHAAHLAGIACGTGYYFAGLPLWKAVRMHTGAVEKEDPTVYRKVYT